MLVLIQTIILYIVLLFFIIFIIWLSIISTLYQNNQCSSIEIQKFIYNNTINSSSIDSRLKLNHFTILGTHNSYHKYGLIGKYEHKDLDKQLSFGIRQIELDIHIMENYDLIYHFQLFGNIIFPSVNSFVKMIR